MSTRDLHEFIPGQFQTITRYPQVPAGPDPKSIMDENLVRMAGYEFELWTEETGGVQLVDGVDYALTFLDLDATASEGFNIWAGYTVITPAYQAVTLYLTAKIVGGYTFRPYRPMTETITADAVIPSDPGQDLQYIVTADAEVTLFQPVRDNQRVTVLAAFGVTARVLDSLGDPLGDADGSGLVYVAHAGKWLQTGGAGGSGGGGGEPAGAVSWWPGVASAPVPAGKLVCDGAIKNIGAYPALFAAIGNTYGGDGVVTFAVPNLQGITPGAAGTQSVNTRTKGDATVIGGVREDQDQLVTGGYTSRRFSGPSANLISPTPPFSTEPIGATEYRYGRESNIGDNEKVTFNNALSVRTGTYSRSTELVGRWVIQAFDSVQIVPGDPATVKDWVRKFENLVTPPDFVVNQWGVGIFYIGIQYLFGTTPGRATVTMFVNPGDGFNRYGLVAMDFTGQDSWLGMNYTDADGRFTPITAGTDYTALKLTAVYKWENVSSAVLSPAVDGWDLVWSGDLNTVPNAWGIGLYEAVLGDPGNYSTSVVRVNDILESVTGTSSETLTDRVDFTGGNFVSPSGIREIRRFSGMLNVFHSYGVPKGHFYGLETEYTTNTGTVKAGECASYGSAFPMALAADMTKLMSAVWDPGNNAGGRFTIIPVSSSVHFFVISDGVRTDCGFDTDIDAVNRPAGWTYYRRVASFKMDSGGLIQTNFQRGDDFTCITRQVITFSTISLTRVTQALPGIPANVELMARMRIKIGGITSGATYVVITETDGADANPATIFDISGTSSFDYGSEFERRVLGPTPSISHRATQVNGTLTGQVLGWRDDRGRFGGK